MQILFWRHIKHSQKPGCYVLFKHRFHDWNGVLLKMSTSGSTDKTLCNCQNYERYITFPNSFNISRASECPTCLSAAWPIGKSFLALYRTKVLIPSFSQCLTIMKHLEKDLSVRDETPLKGFLGGPFQLKWSYNFVFSLLWSPCGIFSIQQNASFRELLESEILSWTIQEFFESKGTNVLWCKKAGNLGRRSHV